MLTLTGLRPYVPGHNRPLSRNCSTFLAWRITMRNIFIIMLTLLHHWRTLQVPSDLGSRVLTKTTHLSSFVNCYVTLWFCAYLTLISHLWLTLMHVVMQPGLYCCSSMMTVCIRLLTIVASTLRRNTTMVGEKKNCWQYIRRVLNGIVTLMVCPQQFTLIMNRGWIFGRSRIWEEDKLGGWNIWTSCP